jgi:hypothetical protein
VLYPGFLLNARNATCHLQHPAVSLPSDVEPTLCHGCAVNSGRSGEIQRTPSTMNT